MISTARLLRCANKGREATGQLDTASEDAIVAVLKQLPRELTVMVASHRAALFECCDTVHELADGRLRSI